MAELTDAEIEQVTLLFGYVPEPEPLEEMLAAVTEIKTRAVKAALRAEHAWLDTAHGNANKNLYSEQYRSGFKAAVGWVDFHAATPEAFRHLKGQPDNG